MNKANKLNRNELFLLLLPVLALVGIGWAWHAGLITNCPSLTATKIKVTHYPKYYKIEMTLKFDEQLSAADRSRLMLVRNSTYLEDERGRQYKLKARTYLEYVYRVGKPDKVDVGTSTLFDNLYEHAWMVWSISENLMPKNARRVTFHTQVAFEGCPPLPISVVVRDSDDSHTNSSISKIK